MLVRHLLMLSAFLLLGAPGAAAAAAVCPDPNTQATPDNLQSIRNYKQSAHQKMFGYFRLWRDEAADPAVNKTSMAELPPCLDLAIVFPYNIPDAGNPVWSAVKNDYIPLLRTQGTKVVWSVFIESLLDPAYPNTAAGHEALAQKIMADTVDKYGTDGLDVDMESYLSSEELAKAKGVFAALSKRLGPKSGTGKLLIYDTNQDAGELFKAVAPMLDYVLIQSYGRSVSGLQTTYNGYAPHIAASKYLIGFSFYEENGGHWRDTQAPIETSRAYQYAKWQPSGTRKGGVFSYAIDRDGVPDGQNAIVPTDYSWTRTLIAAANGYSGNAPPVANFSYTLSGTTASFTDSSSDSDGSIASRRWNFGDGATSTATNPSHTYASGSYTATLTVTDNDGASASQSRTLSVGGGGNTNLALNKPATGSAACTSSEGPAKAVNGSVSGGNSDKFCTVASSRWLQVDLGGSYSVSGFTVKHAGAGGESTAWNTKDFSIQLSSDGSTWTTAINVTGNTSSTTTHAIGATVARYVRLNITTPTQTTDPAARIYEFEVR